MRVTFSSMAMIDRESLFLLENNPIHILNLNKTLVSWLYRCMFLLILQRQNSTESVDPQLWKFGCSAYLSRSSLCIHTVCTPEF